MITYFVFHHEEPAEGFFATVSDASELKGVVSRALDDLVGGELHYITELHNGHVHVDYYDDHLQEVATWIAVPQTKNNTHVSWSVQQGEAA